MVLSVRLKESAKYLKGYNCLADCGTDHGYLPIYAIENNLVNKAIASDNKLGPLKNAKNNILKADLDSKIKIILADGLSYLDSEIDVVSILGMGGRLITKILKDANLSYVKRLVLAPHSESKILREFLMNNNFKITNEEVIIDKDKYYQIIVCEPGTMNLSDIELEFGPINLKSKSKNLINYINKLINQLTNALPNINNLTEKQILEKRIKTLQEVIN